MRTCVVRIATGVVENVIKRGLPSPYQHVVEDAAPPEGCAWIEHDKAGPGWRLVNGELVSDQPPPSAEELAESARVTEIEDSIKAATYGTTQPATLPQLKAMTNAEYSTWFDANFDTAAKIIGLVKRLTLVIIRRVL
jgi:hypothetical protein